VCVCTCVFLTHETLSSSQREIVCAREKERECVCVCEGERECVCVCESVFSSDTTARRRQRERERGRERKRERGRERVRVRVYVDLTHQPLSSGDATCVAVRCSVCVAL